MVLLTEAFDPEVAFSHPSAGAAITSGDVQTGSALHKSSSSSSSASNGSQKSTKHLLMSGVAAKGGLYGAAFPFPSHPFPVALRKVSAELVVEMLRLGGAPLLRYFEQQDTMRHVRDRALSIISAAAVSEWRVVARVGVRGLSLVKKHSMGSGAGNSAVSPTAPSAPDSASASVPAPLPPSNVTGAQPASSASRGTSPKGAAIPAEALSHMLQPMVLRIADARFMSLAFLRGVAKLMKTFPHLADKAMCDRLLHYLREWLDPAKILHLTCKQVVRERNQNEVLVVPCQPDASLAPTQYQPVWDSGEEVLIAACIVDVFRHVDVDAGAKSIDAVVNVVMRLEQILEHYQYDSTGGSVSGLNTRYSSSSSAGSEAEHQEEDGGYSMVLSQLMGNVYGRLSSPLRRPLLHFLNRYPKETMNHFSVDDHLARHTYSHLLNELIDMPDAAPLRDYLCSDEGTYALLTATLNATAMSPPRRTAASVTGSSSGSQTATGSKARSKALLAELMVQGVLLVCTLSKWRPEWLLRDNGVVRALMDRLATQNRVTHLKIEAEQALHHRLVFKHVCQGLISFYRQAQHDEARANDCVDVVYALLPVSMLRSCIDLGFVSLFLLREVARHAPVVVRRKVVEVYAREYRREARKPRMKESVLRLLVIPILAHTFSTPNISNTQVLPVNLLHEIMSEMLVEQQGSSSSSSKINPSTTSTLTKINAATPVASNSTRASSTTPTTNTTGVATATDKTAPSLATKNKSNSSRRSVTDDMVPSSVTEALQVQLLQLSTLLISNCSRDLIEYRKLIVKYAGNHILTEDTASQQWAYVNICTFFNVYTMPSDVILQVRLSFSLVHDRISLCACWILFTICLE